MGSTQPQLFSVRIVSIDYYMATPVPGLDISFSPLHGEQVSEVPVIRVYGSTPAGQKTCLHIHRVLPYLYIPYCDLGQMKSNEVDSCARSLSTALEKALRLKISTGSQRQHVHGCEPVRAHKFYGYHILEEMFLKIYLYYPQDVSRAANLLLSGAVWDKLLQPYESHIPFLLQFLIDYNLYGMGHLHVSKMKFRDPIPNVLSQLKADRVTELGLSQKTSICQGLAGGDPCPSYPIWTSSSIPHGWVWEDCHQTGSFEREDFLQFRRQSTCELEGDAVADDIVNQQFISYTPLTHSHSGVKMVQSLIPIWEEENERDAAPDNQIPTSGRPLPQDVLKIFSDEMLYGDFFGTRAVTEIVSKFTSEPLGSPIGCGDLTEYELDGIKHSDQLLPKYLKANGENGPFLSQGSQMTSGDPAKCRDVHETDKMNEQVSGGQLLIQDAETDAMRLLKWLASSQAMNDINSDDELVSETIFGPEDGELLNNTKMEYERASQKECQDILDSIDFPKCEDLDARTESNYSDEVSLDNVIPQVDGSYDDLPFTLQSNESSPTDTTESKPHAEILHQPVINSNVILDHRKKRPRWGSFPVASQKVTHVGNLDVSTVPGEINDEKNDAFGISCSNEVGNVTEVLQNDKSDAGYTKPSILECSLRDLMRRKRLNQHQNFKYHAMEEKGKEDVISDDDTEKEDMDPLSELKNAFEDDKPPKSLMHKSPYTEVGFPERSVRDTCETFNEIAFGRSSTFFDPSLGPFPLTAKDENASPRVDSCTAHHASSSKSRTVSDVSNCSFLDAEARVLAMTFSRKPPTMDWTNHNDSETAVFLKKEEMDVRGTTYESFPPFFMSCEEEEDQPEAGGKRDQAASPRHCEDINQHYAIGVPTHFCDSSYFFLLGSTLSAPSRESVDTWLSLNQFKPYGKCAESPPLKAKRLSSNVADSQVSSQNDPDSTSLEFCLSSGNSDVIRDPESQENCRTEIKPCDEIPVKTSAGSLPDASQISGPDAKSRLTPLSQVGFRDPASEGQGQQITLLSIEVQAKTRGNLRPDPRFDAISVIVLVCQEDDEVKHDAIVLLHCNSSLPGKDLDGISEARVLVFTEELQLLYYFRKVICDLDPDILMGWDVQSGSIGLLAERAAHLGIDLLSSISRSPSSSVVASVGETGDSEKGMGKETSFQSMLSNSTDFQNTIIDDEWGRTHASGLHVGGRILLNVWRLMRNEVKLNMYTAEAVAEAVLKIKVPSIPWGVLTKWFTSGPAQARYRAINYTLEKARLNLQIINQLDMINRTSELARVFGIDFFSVLSRGSQYRVESMLLRLAHTQNYLAISPGNRQVANQPAMECLPLVMEPESGFYADPVIVLDFQSLYPSMVIAYNLCFSTCLGKMTIPNVLGVSSYAPDPKLLNSMKHELLITPNGVAYVPKKVREGILPKLLDEILSTRIMVKQAMKKLAPSHRVRQRILNARQLALKLIANVTYGYTAAGFSGRMPCAELADSIVQCGRKTLERAIAFVNSNEKWKARVVYGDTDSMFVLLKGRSRQEAFRVGEEIASAVTEMNPDPVKLKMEKVYHPCFLLTKKRYVGYSFESPDQSKPTFDAKGIETVRRDTCGAVSKMLEKSLKLYFESQDSDKVKAYLQRQWTRILTNRVSLEDFIFAKEVRLGTYSGQAHSLPPAAIVAMKSMAMDPRAEPRYAERVPYVVVYGEPGSRLADMVVNPHELLDMASPLRLNGRYYITKQIIPALQRVFGLVGADLHQWFLDMPRPIRESVGRRHHMISPNERRTRIDSYYRSRHCILCGEFVHGSAHLCSDCSDKETSVCVALTGRTCKLEREIHHLNAICRHCGGGDWCVESGVKCESLACPVFFQRRKVQKQLHSLSQLSAAQGFYPQCNVEWF